VTRQPAASGTPARTAPAPQLIRSCDGLNHRQQRLANGANQFLAGAPDQGLWAGTGYVMEIINDVMRVYDASGNPLRSHRPQHVLRYSPSSTGRRAPRVPSQDPSCLFDKATQRWYADVLTLEVYPDTGNSPARTT